MNNSDELCGMTKIKTINFSYIWAIHNFSFNNKAHNEGLSSPYFKMPRKKHFEWYLSLFPKGVKDNNNDSSRNYVGIYLHLEAVNPSINTSIAFCILNSKKEEIHTLTTDHLYKKAEGHGFSSFIAQNVLSDPMNDLLPNNKLTIVCKVTAGVEIENCCKDIIKFEDYRNKFTINSDFESLLANKQMTDITLIAEGKELEAHKVVLAARSPVFLTMLQTDMQEKQNCRVEIDDVTYDVFSEVLQYMYTGKVKDIKKYATDSIIMADRYDIKGLKLMCEELFYNELSIDNAIILFILADRHNCHVLRPLILKFIITHAKDILKTAEFKKFEKDLPILVKEMIHAVV